MIEAKQPSRAKAADTRGGRRAHDGVPWRIAWGELRPGGLVLAAAADGNDEERTKGPDQRSTEG